MARWPAKRMSGKLRLMFVLLFVMWGLFVILLMSRNHTSRVVDQASGLPLADVYVKLGYVERKQHLWGNPSTSCIGEKPMIIVRTDKNGRFKTPPPTIPPFHRLSIAVVPNDVVIVSVWFFKPGYVTLEKNPPTKEWKGLIDYESYEYGDAPAQFSMELGRLEPTIEMEYLAELHGHFTGVCDSVEVLPEVQSDIAPAMRPLVAKVYEPWRASVLARGERPEDQLGIVMFLREVGYVNLRPDLEMDSEGLH